MKPNILLYVLSVIIMLTITSHSSNLFSKIQMNNSFCEVLKENWNEYSGNQNEVTKLHLISKLSNPELKNEKAAALVSLLSHLRKEKLKEITKEEALALCNNKDVVDNYDKNAEKLIKANRQLFANGKPTFELMQQGPLGDCYFFSGIGWIVKFRNHEIVEAIKVMDDNKYRVRFPDGSEAEISGPTDAELAYNYSESTLSDGIWAAVLEKAFGTILGKLKPNLNEYEDPTSKVDVGGGPGPDVKRWTGHEVELFHLQKTSEEKVKEALEYMEKHNAMSQALVQGKPKGKIIGDHVYAIMGFDSKTDLLTVWNPWGTDFEHKGEDSPENGYNRHKGMFKISLKDFMYLFNYLAIEKK